MKCFSILLFVFLGLFSFYVLAQKSKDESIEIGSEIYLDFCARCHKRDGLGIESLIPPLKHSDYLLNNYDLSIAGLKFGLSGRIVVNGKIYEGYMAYQGLDHEEIADVMNYILNEWGNQSDEFITAKQVAKIPKSILKQ